MSTAQQQQPAQAATRTRQTDEDFDRLLQREHEPFSAFGSINQFADAQRMARMLCGSNIVPDAYRGEANLGNCVIALEIANRIGASVLAVMQNLYIVHGKPAWSSQFLISCVNASRRFSPLRYEVSKPGEPREIAYKYTVYVNREKVVKEGKIKVQDQTCKVWAVDKTGERLEGPTVSIEMAIKEGWFTKEGSKWQTMPDLMIRYRAATFFTRLYAPELTMGINTEDEASDVSEALPVIPAQEETVKKTRASKSASVDKPKFGEPVETQTSTIPTAGEATNQPTEEPKPEIGTDRPSVATNNKPSPADTSSEKEPELLAANPDSDVNTPQGKLRRFLEDAGVNFEKFRAWTGQTDRLKDADSFGSWAELPGDWCDALAKDPKALSKCITLCR